MDHYVEETLNFIESAEMRNYLRTRADRLDPDACAEIVAKAPATLERKIPALELIAEQTGFTTEWCYNDPAKLANAARAALDERYGNNPPGTIFLLDSFYIRSGEQAYREGVPYTTFDAAAGYIQKQKESFLEDGITGLEKLSREYYTIEKYIPGLNGEMELCRDWMLTARGDIWYSGCWQSTEPQDFEGLDGGEIRLPVPFQPGDIVLADCRPFAEKRHVVITDIGDNRDCCAVQCLYLRHDFKTEISALQHQFFLNRHEFSPVSVLYRAALCKDELPEHEEPLRMISEGIKKAVAAKRAKNREKTLEFLRELFETLERGIIELGL